MAKSKRKKWVWIATGVLVAWFVPWVFALHFGFIVYFPYEPNGTDRFVRATGPLVSMVYPSTAWVSTDEIPKTCRRALVAAEDGRFYDHYGIDPDGIEYAYNKNKKRHNKKLVGGSTITQQLVKNVFLHRKKTYLRKTREAVGALLLDRIMSKDQQITWYFNVVEFGPRVYGLGAAAQFYFHKKAKQLSSNECMALVSILRDPNRQYRLLLKKAWAPHLERRQLAIARRMSQLGS